MDQGVLITALVKLLAELDNEALEALRGWVSQWGYGDEGKDILKFKDEYPKPSNTTLHRVVSLDAKGYEALQRKGLKSRNKYLESWSLTDRAVTAYSEDYADSLDEDWDLQYLVFFRKKIPKTDVIVDLTQVAHLLPEEVQINIDIEKEVITTPQPLTKADIYKVLTYDPATGKKTKIR